MLIRLYLLLRRPGFGQLSNPPFYVTRLCNNGQGGSLAKFATYQKDTDTQICSPGFPSSADVLGNFH